MKCFALADNLQNKEKLDWKLFQNINLFGITFFRDNENVTISSKNKLLHLKLFFIKDIKNNVTQLIQDQIKLLLQSVNLDKQPAQSHTMQTKGYWFHLVTYNNNYCVIVTNTELNKEQLSSLNFYLLYLKVPKSIVANTIDQFLSIKPLQQLKKEWPSLTKENIDANWSRKVKHINDELEATKKILHQCIDQLMENGATMKDIMKKSEELRNNSITFKHETQKLNSCWPQWCKII